MTCREASNLLPLFFDGELDPRQMRAVALHGTRCQPCETELRRLERVQDLVSETINSAVDEIDLSNFWPGIEDQLGAVRVSRWERARERWRLRWREGELRWAVRIPLLAAAAAAVLALFLFSRALQPGGGPDASQIVAVDHSAQIESLDTDSDSVAVLNDPETSTTVLWVNDGNTEALP
jgi:anti-sigma factor RsiW